jgi:hypothetical protein
MKLFQVEAEMVFQYQAGTRDPVSVIVTAENEIDARNQAEKFAMENPGSLQTPSGLDSRTEIRPPQYRVISCREVSNLLAVTRRNVTKLTVETKLTWREMSDPAFLTYYRSLDASAYSELCAREPEFKSRLDSLK